MLCHHACPEGTWESVFSLPDRRLWPGVRCYRGFRFALPQPRRRLEVPNGSVTLMLGFGSRLDLHGATETGSYHSLLAGLRTGPVIGEHDGRLHGVEIILSPWAAFALFGAALADTPGNAADPTDILGPRVRRLTERLAETPTWPERFARLDATLLRWSASGRPHAPQVAWAWEELRRTGGTAPLDALAARSGWSKRQFHHHFVQQIGTTPKTAARIHRLGRVLRLLATDLSYARTAEACGFFDQSHLNREFTAMTGLTPGRFRADRTSGAGAPGEQDRLRGEVTSVLLPHPA
ncbi:AraC family transcriptional regulator [Streptomyces purpureus]|uniref:AraC-family regulatory protein n=1 Tax=Streptomyces purpureus TaxID=1951 RepID=A0A918H114_9ACTN|nr:helix-turn-helix domain-containing protein [Streptomyces purpureus]GGT30910.1 putative AraC-family regulatory protein [Streptomyces purpureus]